MYDSCGSCSKMMSLSLPGYMMQRRIQDCAVNVLVELVQRLRLNELFTIQLDKSTDNVNLAILLVFPGMFMRMNFWQISYFENHLKHKQQGNNFFRF
jgi:hypothetical protein